MEGLKAKSGFKVAGVKRALSFLSKVKAMNLAKLLTLITSESEVRNSLIKRYVVPSSIIVFWKMAFRIDSSWHQRKK